MIANRLPNAFTKDGAFKARFFRLRFHTRMGNLEEERVIATLWGCMQRRIKWSPYALAERLPEGEVKLEYNQCKEIVVPCISNEQ